MCKNTAHRVLNWLSNSVYLYNALAKFIITQVGTNPPGEDFGQALACSQNKIHGSISPILCYIARGWRLKKPLKL
jgi:hypothetical protein